jgi:hypothetical protein
VADIAAVAPAFGTASNALLSWPTTVGNDRWLDRAELSQLAAPITSDASSTTLLLGPPGSGKSALLAKLGRQCADAGQTLLALKADTLSTGVDSLGKLSEELHLPALVTDCILALAASGKVLVLIDQLDALADLVDLRSERLNVLLNLIKQLSDQPNVHVVCSCREFEHGHDPRLLSIKADVVTLALPTWERVAEVLRDREIEASLWPNEFREMLRTPQHLKIFLQRLRGTAEDRVFTTYQQLLEDLWERCVTNPDGLPGRSQMLTEMAADMAERENIWLPAVRYEERRTLITDLEAKGILAASENGLSVGFQHQTFLEHARARAFARGQGTLAGYVLQRQDGLFVRPILWSSLHFLRGADPDAYHREMEALWKEPLRKHVRHLLIDFLGQASYPLPSEAEQRWLIEYLQKPDSRTKVLAAIRGSSAWFTILAPGHFPPLMQRPEADAGPMVAVLGAAWRNHRSECLSLIKRHWLSDTSKDTLTWRTLDQLTEWDREAVDVAVRIIQRSDINSSAVMFLASQVAEGAPDLAVELVATKFQADISKLEAMTDPVPPALPPDADDVARIVQRATFRPRERFERLLRASQNWYGLPALAEAAPQAFLERIWPLFVRVVGHLLQDRERVVDRYRHDWSLVTRLGNVEEDERVNPVVGAVEVALTALAQQNPGAYLSLLEREKSHDIFVVQRLFCRSLVHCTAGHPGACLQFLTDDRRRLALGSMEDEHADTRALIAALVPHLTESHARMLEDAVLQWSNYRDDLEEPEAAARFERRKWDRQHRLRLLTAFPLERLSAASQAHVRGEQVALPGYEERGVHTIRGGFIGSPMSAEQMARASIDDIVRLFTIYEDTAEHHPKDMLRGGSSEASSEFGRFAKDHPERALAIIRRFNPGRQERPAAYGLFALSEKVQVPDTLCSLVLELDQRGFRNEEFRVHAARALGNCAREGAGLPEAICTLLERWLGEPWTRKDAEVTRGERDQTEDAPRSVLWQRDGLVMLPFGTYHLLHALTRGYLLRNPPAADRWLLALEAHLERPESPEVWRVLCGELQYLHLCDHGRATAFLQRLFEKHPAVRDSQLGAVLLTHAWSFLPARVMQQCLHAMRDGSWEEGPQAFGELLALRTLFYPEDRWAKDEVHRALGGAAEPVQNFQQVRTGLGFTAAQLWHKFPYREQAGDILVKLIPLADVRVSHAVMHVFLATGVLYADEPSRLLLRTLLAYPDTLRATEDSFLVERLEDILPAEPQLVLDFCRELVRVRADELTSIRTGFAVNTSHLTNIALTLQRLGGDFRKQGLDLFEKLLDLGVQDAHATLQELDKRPRSIPQPIRRRLRGTRRRA